LLTFVILVLGVPISVLAGPPYITDDPEPVNYQHWEIYFASIFTKQPDAWTATAPHLEVNYGAVRNLQVHAILPMSLYAPSQGGNSYGYADTELGVKYRFVSEAEWLPQIGTFPLLEVPTGSHKRNLGSSHLQTFLPLWIQKSIGSWTAYGGVGYWINPGAHNHNWWFNGLVVQCEIFPGLTPGLEVFHGTSQVVGGPRELGLNFGLIWDRSEHQHVIFSTGPSLEGSNELQGYFAYQLTF
jgi:hypothetical protein